ncbi:hypothetical protein SUGI_0091170 [Cryptomeria japonica]|nr:hypothetical protein SUGI_0091170 [Cryptomeria japonica]
MLRSMRKLLGGVRYFSRENNWKDLKWFEANRAPLTPISFLERAGSVYRDGASIIHGSTRFTWAQTLDRCIRLASALTSLHVKPGDVVSVVAPNIPATIPELSETSSNGTDYPYLEYERLLQSGDPSFKICWPEDEWDAITLNYTSAAQGGTGICLRNLIAKDIYDAICEHKVTHLCAAPTVLNIISNALPHERRPLPHRVEVMTGGSPPPPLMLTTMEKLGFNITHIYGLTETYGPISSCLWNPEWDLIPSENRAKLKSRQGVPHLGVAKLDVKISSTMQSVPHDGTTIGEIMIKGNVVMSGYLKNPDATEKAFEKGWFHTGDLGVVHPDGYIELKDRSKDVIISGGENVSSIEVETVLYSHPSVLEAAVVGRPDDYWGETPCAFVMLKDSAAAPDQVSPEDIINFCRNHLPHYMSPRTEWLVNKDLNDFF